MAARLGRRFPFRPKFTRPIVAAAGGGGPASGGATVTIAATATATATVTITGAAAAATVNIAANSAGGVTVSGGTAAAAVTITAGATATSLSIPASAAVTVTIDAAAATVLTGVAGATVSIVASVIPVPVQHFTGPTIRDQHPRWTNDLMMRFFTQDRGVTVVLYTDGSHAEVTSPTDESLRDESVLFAFRGGYDYVLTTAQAAALTAAGYETTFVFA